VLSCVDSDRAGEFRYPSLESITQLDVFKIAPQYRFLEVSLRVQRRITLIRPSDACVSRSRTHASDTRTYLHVDQLYLSSYLTSCPACSQDPSSSLDRFSLSACHGMAGHDGPASPYRSRRPCQPITPRRLPCGERLLLRVVWRRASSDERRPSLPGCPKRRRTPVSC
jgi:hypothetical protein